MLVSNYEAYPQVGVLLQERVKRRRGGTQVSTPGPLGAASVPDCCTPARQCVRGLVSAMQSLELPYVRSRSSFAEAFHGWTTGTLVWRQRCDFDLNLWRTGGIANDKLNEKSMKVTTISHTCGSEYQGEKRKPKANISKTLNVQKASRRKKAWFWRTILDLD